MSVFEVHVFLCVSLNSVYAIALQPILIASEKAKPGATPSRHCVSNSLPGWGSASRHGGGLAAKASHEADVC